MKGQPPKEGEDAHARAAVKVASLHTLPDFVFDGLLDNTIKPRKRYTRSKSAIGPKKELGKVDVGAGKCALPPDV
jgi:hypothetical protein